MFKRFAAVSMISVSMTLSAAAQIPAPAIQPVAAPTTQPAPAPVVPMDQSTPRGTIKVFSSAIQSGDKSALSSVLYATNPLETKMAGAMVESAEAVANLDKAARKAFGRATTQETMMRDKAIEAAMARIDGATETITDKTATVSMGGDMRTPPVNLCLVNGKWMLPMSDMMKGAQPADVEQEVASRAVETQVLREMASDMNDGKFKSVDEARAAFGQKMMAAQMKQQADTAAVAAAPTTAPSKPAPTTAPAAPEAGK